MPSDVELNRLAQRFYEASGISLPRMTDKPMIVAGLRGVFEAYVGEGEQEPVAPAPTTSPDPLRERMMRLRADMMRGAVYDAPTVVERLDAALAAPDPRPDQDGRADRG